MEVFGIFLANLEPLKEIQSVPLFMLRVGGLELPFTNHMFMIMLASIVLMVGFPMAIRKKTLVPRGFHNLIETICVFIRDDVARPFLKDKTDQFVYTLWTMFFFILSMNLLGLIPLDKIIWMFTGKENHFAGAATGNIYVTGALATFAFVMFHAAGIRQKGLKKYLATLSPEVPWPMFPFMFCMELLSSFVRLFSLAIRLFANIMAGHILLAVLLGFIILFKNFMVASASIMVTTIMSLLEVFVAFLQAYIFTFLTTIFIGFAISDEH